MDVPGKKELNAGSSIIPEYSIPEVGGPGGIGRRMPCFLYEGRIARTDPVNLAVAEIVFIRKFDLVNCMRLKRIIRSKNRHFGLLAKAEYLHNPPLCQSNALE